VRGKPSRLVSIAFKSHETFRNIDKKVSRIVVSLKIIEGKIMKKLFAGFFRWLAVSLEEEQKTDYQPETNQNIEQKPSSVIEEKIKEAKEIKKPPKKIRQKEDQKKENKNVRRKKIKEGEIITIDPRDIRDVMEVMEVPFVSLSKNRTAPINYESSDGKIKVRISCHTNHYLASIYDWDIILFVASKMQEILNSGEDIPPRTLVVPRHELLRAIFKHGGKTNRKEIEESLARLQLTGIETTIRNEDYRYRGGFGFLDSWGYTERKDIKEFCITLSQWLYDGICRKGSLLKVRPEYFRITSGLKKFLYRTARKHVGNQNQSWDFLIETLYEKSGSEREFKKFKHDLKKAVSDNDIPSYFMKWIEKDGRAYVRFVSIRKKIRETVEENKKTKETL
jgi:plasmid replication initiation protein